MEQKITFEAASARIAEIVKLLEDKNTPLDDSLALFSEGVELIKIANAILEAAEQKVTVLTDGEKQ